jgi:hypothetical protein
MPFFIFGKITFFFEKTFHSVFIVIIYYYLFITYLFKYLFVYLFFFYYIQYTIHAIVPDLSFNKKYSDSNNLYIKHLTIEKLVMKFSNKIGIGSTLNVELLDGLYKMFFFLFFFIYLFNLIPFFSFF